MCLHLCVCRHKGEQRRGIGAEPPWLIETQIKLESDREEGADVEIERKRGKQEENTAAPMRRGAGVWAVSVTVQKKDPIKAFGFWWG